MATKSIPLKHLAFINERSLPETTNPDTEIRYIDIGSVGRGKLIDTPKRMRFGDAPSRARRLVAPGDTVVSTVRTYLRAVWSVTEDYEDVVVSTGFAVLTPKEVESRYFSWWIMSDAFIEEVVARSVGVSYPAINWSELGEISIRLPSIKKQRAISDYLDIETARIDTLISKKCLLVELLRQRWIEFRRDRVLCGLDPVRGGGLTEPWEEMNLGILIELQRGHDLPSDNRIEGDIPVVSSGGVSGSHNVAICDGPGVVTGRYGTVGEVFFISGPYWPLNTTLYVKNFRGNHPQWVYHLLASLPLDIDSQKSAVGGINRNVVGSLRVPRPPVSVQITVARDLDDVEVVLTEARRKLEAQIHLLIERRQALITALVTGDIPVPDVAA